MIVLKEINKNSSPSKDKFKCADCVFEAKDNGGLKIHTDMHIKLKCDQCTFKAVDFKGLRSHKLSCFNIMQNLSASEEMKRYMKVLHNEA